MSMTIIPSAGTGGMMLQLQRLQQNMKYLQQAAGQRPQSLALAPEHFEENTPRVADTQKAQQAQGVTAATQAGSFGELLEQAFENVNTQQVEAAEKETRFDMGDRTLTLSDVMLTSQKARISFEAAVQIRNRMVEAYRTISQMQI